MVFMKKATWPENAKESSKKDVALKTRWLGFD
jgi:hypothetical protein